METLPNDTIKQARTTFKEKLGMLQKAKTKLFSIFRRRLEKEKVNITKQDILDLMK